MTKSDLNRYADTLELILTSHHLTARVAGGQVHPDGATRFMLNTIGVSLADLERLQDEVRASLHAASARPTRAGGGLLCYDVTWGPQ